MEMNLPTERGFIPFGDRRPGRIVGDNERLC
jgi:hypothetical protein